MIVLNDVEDYIRSIFLEILPCSPTIENTDNADEDVNVADSLDSCANASGEICYLLDDEIERERQGDVQVSIYTQWASNLNPSMGRGVG